MKKIIAVVIFCLSGCGSSAPKFYPEGHALPEGHVGQNYLSEIEIANVVLFKDNIGVDITPSDAGLKWMPKVTLFKRGGQEREVEDYHYITISGKPRKEGDVLIHINGYSMGTAISGSEIDKVYIIKVKGDGD